MPPAARPLPPHAPDPVTQPVLRAYDRYAAQARRWAAEYEARGGHIYCGAGCHFCCDMPIRVSLAEARITAEALTLPQARAFEVHARAVQRNARTSPDEETFVARHRIEISFCPLLDRQTGSCTAYAVRPTRCRDTFSALPAHYCACGTWENMTRREQTEYRHEVARTSGTDGELHFIAPLEHLSEPVWAAASKAMRRAWGLEVWGDFWTLTTLARDPGFMARVEAGNRRGALSHARGRGFGHPVTLEIA
ncbi:Putative zinc-or iron-chelating domain-containing protein [Deinococcus reticulitermitis]|uniref:Putative zinc-or iron-chelating domain-containing protein n=1 Tax=Deinococcus reticulitermitis TaxID=856736 RepID=A0A1H6T1E1_9DEIO|nr:YkgJ family cysteine cluster protein [Deinococcus reticulitermitis]SEI73871.1 Putative zinc-or iron-chelating domain-containing protein [Deinococcus reticulitermitis]